MEEWPSGYGVRLESAWEQSLAGSSPASSATLDVAIDAFNASLFMRIIFLNSWFGEAGKPFFDFIKRESSKTDIFCFMEFTPELFGETSNILHKYNGFIEKGMIFKHLGVTDCQVIFIRKNIETLSSGKLVLYKNTPTDVGFASYIVFKEHEKIVNILNIHGKSRPGHKLDTPARLNQSKILIDYLKDKNGLKIIGGDFNLMPNTKSIALLEGAGYRNLIRDFDIKETRNRISWEQFPNNVKQHFADYVFVSPDVKVNKFEVPYNEISDHLPLILDFEV
jgi:hypothetical protein